MELPFYKEMVYTSPNVTFKDEMVIYLGGREIRIKHFIGHTRGDAVVHLPAENILNTGDLVIHPVPYGIRTFFKEWVKAFDMLMNMNAEIIIPGHVDIQYSNLESFRLKLAGDDPDKNWAFKNYFLIPAVERAFQDAKTEI